MFTLEEFPHPRCTNNAGGSGSLRLFGLVIGVAQEEKSNLYHSHISFLPSNRNILAALKIQSVI